jgi:hypothetical protein
MYLLIHVLDVPDGHVTESKDMLKVAIDYYKDLFKFEDRQDIRLKDDFFSEEEKLTDEENAMLGSAFTKKKLGRLSLVHMLMELLDLMAYPLCFTKKFGILLRRIS